MTISSANRKAGPFTGNGVTVAFPFTFKVFTTADVLVVQAVASTGVETVKLLTTDYTVALNPDQNASPGGTITMLAAPPIGETITATSQVAQLQSTELTNAGGFYPSVLNSALDKLTILVQQMQVYLTGALKLPLSAASGVSATLPTPSGGKLLGWAADGLSIANLQGTGVGAGTVTELELADAGVTPQKLSEAVRSSAHQTLSSVAGTNTITGTLTPAITSYVAGQTFRFVAAGSNTGATTININGVGAVAITKNGASALGVGDIVSGVVVQIHYDGTQFQLMSGAGSSGSDTLNTTRIDVASATTTDLTANAPNTRNINITGTTAITGFTVAIGQTYFVRFNAALTLTNNSAIVTQTGANITTRAGDTCILRATAANTVEVLSYVSALASSPVETVRQTILAGSVDANGFAAFGGSTGSSTVTASATLIATAANGVTNRRGTIVAPAWAGLTTNGTMYLGLTVNADGTCTPFSTTLAPTYRWGGADVVTANQRTFNIQEMAMKVGNGTTAAQAYDVFVGEVTVAGGVVTAITWYALMGRYVAPAGTNLNNSSTLISLNHNIGVDRPRHVPNYVCNSAEGGYSVGDGINVVTNAGGTPTVNEFCNRLSVGLTISNANCQIYNKTTAAVVTMSLAKWDYRPFVDRGW